MDERQSFLLTFNRWNLFVELKMKAMRLILVGLFLNACATHRQSQLSSMGVGAILGGSLGAMSAPKDESKLTHGALWAGLLSSTLAIASLYLFDNQKATQDFKAESESLKLELMKLRNSDMKHNRLSKNKINRGSGFSLPHHFSPLCLLVLFISEPLYASRLSQAANVANQSLLSLAQATSGIAFALRAIFYHFGAPFLGKQILIGGVIGLAATFGGPAIIELLRSVFGA
ncbi:MAG: hypothetical protein IPK68_21300 [Bdellovibrionales bacterium]|nr:hypothetical protein [Bdellovibrionales bacterium]